MTTNDKYYLWKYKSEYNNDDTYSWVIIKGNILEQKYVNEMPAKCEGIVIKCCQKYRKDFSIFSSIPKSMIQSVSLNKDETTSYDTIEDVLRMNFAFFLSNP